MAATSAPTARLAAARGLPMLLGVHMSDAEKSGMVERYDAAARDAGHDPDAVHHVSAMLAQVADSRARAEEQVRAAGTRVQQTVDQVPPGVKKGVPAGLAILAALRTVRQVRNRMRQEERSERQHDVYAAS